MNLKQGDQNSQDEHEGNFTRIFLWENEGKEQDQHTGKQKQAGDETAPDRLFSHFRTGSIVGKDFIDGRI
jgi:hypothetical protein